MRPEVVRRASSAASAAGAGTDVTAATWAETAPAPPVVLRRRGRWCTASSSASLALIAGGVWGSLSLSPGTPGLLALPRRRDPPPAVARLRLVPPRAALCGPLPGGCLKREVPASATSQANSEARLRLLQSQHASRPAQLLQSAVLAATLCFCK